MVAAKSFLKPALLPALLLFCLTSLFAQSNAVEAMWQEQMDTSENSIVKPMYLEVNKDDVEGLLAYNRYTSMLRVGICLKPPLRDLY